MAMAARTATISRKTNETEIEVYINLDCQPGSASQQVIDVSTGIGFLDHVRSPPNLAHRLVHSQIDLCDPWVCMHP
jgi:imidazoleglycerol phosphate dehydratase HisB